jgi:glucose/arabinose dehydrogenase
MIRRVFHLLIWAVMAGLMAQSALAGTPPLEYQDQIILVDGTERKVRVPAGYRLELLTDRLKQPRLLSFAPNDDLFIGSRSGEIYRLKPPYNDPTVLLRLGDYPHSVAFRPHEILIAQTSGLYVAPYEPGQEAIPPNTVHLMARLPGGGGHTSRTVRVGPDGRIYLSLGISHNCSDQYLDESYPFDARRGGVLVFREDTNPFRWKTYASGLRNPVGFDWDPSTGVLYASNNGPDHLGYDQPPEYFSRLDPGSFHGMPWFQYDGARLHRDSCIRGQPPRPLRDVSMPVATFPARNAPMAVAFMPLSIRESRLRGDAIVALHGSWATRPSGGFWGAGSTRRVPKVVAVRFSKGTAQRVDDLITGFQLPDGERWARPVGVAVGGDGTVYFSSDSEANALFRLRPSE